MNWFKRPKATEEIGLSGTMWLVLESNWSFNYEIGHLLTTAVLPIGVELDDVKYGPNNPRESVLSLSREGHVSGVHFIKPENPDNRRLNSESWKGSSFELTISENKSTDSIEKLFKIGQGWKVGEEFIINLELSEDEIRKLLMLAPYEFSDLVTAILQMDRITVAPEGESVLSEVTFAVTSIKF